MSRWKPVPTLVEATFEAAIASRDNPEWTRCSVDYLMLSDLLIKSGPEPLKEITTIVQSIDEFWFQVVRLPKEQ